MDPRALGPLRTRLCANGIEILATLPRAPISKHQIPNNIQIPISNHQNRFVSEFGHLVIGNYLKFGIWGLGFQSLFASRCVGLRK
jgi:hypothetical protein